MAERAKRFDRRPGDGITYDRTRDAVLHAYRQAVSARLDAAECYRAATNAWCSLHPDHNRSQAARRAVQVVHDTFGRMQDMARAVGTISRV
jgi:hypothetical protein